MIMGKLKTTSFLLVIIFLFHFTGYSQNEKVDYDAIKNSLDEIGYKDQQYREQLDSIREIYGRNSPQMDSVWNLINIQDSLNREKVFNILDTYGWPDTSQIGIDGNLAIWAAIQHTPDLKIQEEYLPLMKEAVKNGLDKMYLAYTIDRIAMMKSKYQTYGTQIYPYNNGYIVFPVKDPHKVDERRKEFGLGPLAQYARRYKIEWNPEEHKKNSRKILREIKQKRKEYLKKQDKK